MIHRPEMLIETPDMTSQDSFAISYDLVSELLSACACAVFNTVAYRPGQSLE